MKNLKVKIYQHFYNFAELAASVLLMRPKGAMIQKIEKVKYGTTRRSVCDYIYPKASNDKLPIMVYVHGGGWISGLRKVRKYYCYEYAEKGFFVVNIDYDYGVSENHPFQINQILTVIDQLYDKRNELNINFDQLIIGGDSAGAYLASMVAAVVNCKPIDNISTELKHFGKYKVKALLAMCGAYSLSDLYKNQPLRPINTFLSSYTGIQRKNLNRLTDDLNYDLKSIINENFPRTFIIKAINDKLIVESNSLERLLSSLNVQFDSFLATGLLSFHCFPLMCKTTVGRECLQLSVETLKKYAQ